MATHKLASDHGYPVVTLEDQLPHNVDAERQVLGRCLIDPETRHEVGFLTPADFFIVRHQWIFDAIQRAETPDYMGVSEVLRAEGRLQEAGGIAYLIEISNDMPFSIDIMTSAHVVKDEATRARLALYGNARINDTLQTRDIHAMIARADAELRDIADAHARQYDTSRDSVAIANNLTDSILAWKSAPGELRGIGCGLEKIDRSLSGFRRSLLYYVSGRPGMGKSALLARATWGAAEKGARILLFALEMTAEGMMQRMACQMAKANSTMLEAGTLPDHKFRDVHNAIDRLTRMRIVIEDRPGLSIQEMQAIARRHEKNGGLDIVIVDTLNLVASSGNSAYERMTNASHAAKDWAHGSGYALIAAAQLSRANQKLADKRPTLDALRDSGALEEDADCILGVHREGAYNWEDKDLEHKAELLVMKYRYGEAFKRVDLYWDETWPGFENADVRHADLDFDDDRTILGQNTH